MAHNSCSTVNQAARIGDVKTMRRLIKQGTYCHQSITGIIDLYAGSSFVNHKCYGRLMHVN